MRKQPKAAEQLPLLSHDLPPLKLRDQVRTPEGWIGEIAQINLPGERYAVFSWTWSGPVTARLPLFRRDELKLIEGEERG